MGPEEAAEQQLQHRAEARAGERGVEHLVQGQPVAHGHDKLARGFHVERGIDGAAGLAALQGRDDGGAGLADVAVEHGADVGVADRLRHRLGAKGASGSRQQLLQLVDADAGERLHRVVGLCHAFEERGVLGALGFGDGGDDGDLAGEVAVERPGTHPGLRADLVHGRAVEARAGEAGHGGVDDALAGRVLDGVRHGWA